MDREVNCESLCPDLGEKLKSVVYQSYRSFCMEAAVLLPPALIINGAQMTQ